MFFHHRDEFHRGVPRERRLREVWVSRNKIFWLAIGIREVTTTAAGDKNFLARTIGAFEHRDAPAAPTGLCRAHQSCGSGAKNQRVKLVNHRSILRRHAKTGNRDVNLRSVRRPTFSPSTMPPVIQVSGVRKTYRRTVAVDEVSFNVNEGEIFGLIGPNGAGKTTTMECIEGLRKPDRGTISVLGLDPFRQVYKLQERIGVQLQQAQLQKRIKVWEAVDLWASLYKKKAVDGEHLLEQLGLIDKRDAWFMNLSGGQKQRLFIALALINDPEVVFLDELTTGLDPQSRRAIWELVRGIRDRGKTVFLTTHLMEEAERLCDRVAIIEHGRIIDIDTPERLVNRHCPERTVVLVTEASVSEERFRAIPGVETVVCNDLRFTIRGRGDDLVSDVIHCLSENQIRVTDFRTILPNLEDVFLKLTGHSIRE
jgi:ABC-2 type transport system ATP-binding protein